MAGENLDKRVAGLETEVARLRDRLAAFEARAAAAPATAAPPASTPDLQVLRQQVGNLTAEKQQLAQRLDQVLAARPQPTPTQLVGSFRNAMEQLRGTLEPKPGERVGYDVGHFDVELKAGVNVDAATGDLRFALPEVGGETLPSDQLSTIRFTFRSLPKADVRDADLVEVPTVVGLALDTAVRQLAQKGLAAGAIQPQQSPLAPGTVLAQSPEAGDLVPPASAVDLVVAQKPGFAPLEVEVPDLSGLSRSEAQGRIVAAGLVVGAVSEQESLSPAGTVIAQQPAAGTQVSPGSSVALVLAIPLPVPQPLPIPKPLPSRGLGDYVDAILRHPEFPQVVVPASEFPGRLTAAGVNSVAALQSFAQLEPKEMRTRLNLQTVTNGVILKRILDQVLHA